MTPVFQTKLPPQHQVGNCLAAVVASLLDLKIDEVPNFEVLGECENRLWLHVMSRFYWHYGYNLETLWSLHEYHVRGGNKFPAECKDVPYCCYGEVMGTPHVVIMANGRLVHDPTPSGAGLDIVTDVWVLRHRIDPAKNGGLATGKLLTLPEITYSTVPQVPDY